jgi:hypothetical protein
MKRFAPADLPRMREQRLVIDDLPDEVLVYDLDRHKAHCLNQTAAMVWRACNGRTSASAISSRLTRELRTPFSEDLVWLALRQLEKLNLLEQSISLPPQFLGISRRQMIRNLGLAASVAVPVVTSIVSPTPSQAATCAARGESCLIKSCCSGLSCNGGTCP